MSESVETYVRNAEQMARRAIEAREKIYQGMREAVLAAPRVRRGRLVHGPEDAKQKFLTSQTAKGFISDNRWNMMQCVMYSVLGLSRAAVGMLAESRKQTKLLENMDKNIAEVLYEIRSGRDS